MKPTSVSSWGSGILRTIPVVAVGVVCLGAMVLAQKNSVQPQPQADRLAPVSVPTRGAGGRGPAQKPEGVMPSVPAGFNVSIYAELPAPRMMVYAPNGDLFVSSPMSNNITVLRDANNDGVFEMRGVYAQGAVGGRGGGGGAAAGGAGGAPRGGPPAAGAGGAPGAARERAVPREAVRRRQARVALLRRRPVRVVPLLTPVLQPERAAVAARVQGREPREHQRLRER